MNKWFFLIVHLVFVSAFSFAQKDKGDKYFENGQYARAIPKYEKAAKKQNSEQQDALIRLGDCYRILNEYKSAEDAYRKALALKGTLPADFRYNYGSVLKTNHNYSEALYQFMAYAEEKPNDAKAKNAVRSCQEIKYWMRRPIEYDVKNVEGINTPKSEYCPVILNNKLVFVSDKQTDYLEMSVNDIDGQPFTDIYITNIKRNKSSREKTFSGKINSAGDEGPVSFSADGKTLLFTRVDNKVDPKNKDFVNRAKIYFATGQDQRWGNIKPFVHNSDDYSVAHPCLSPDGNYLFFTSDMKGGQGGKDLWYCKKSGDSWEKPVNLGTDVNTSGDEMFPYVRKDGTLFFSSTGLAGFGGLDIFSAKEKEGKWLVSRNESMHLNSTYDDFGVCFTTDTTGYFSSNREGGEGKDDIWWFKYTSRYTTVSGSVLLTENINDPAKNVKVFLKTPDGKKLDSIRTNTKGFFEFRNLDNDKKYLAVVDSDDPSMEGKARYYMADNKGVIMRVTGPSGPDKYAFKNLPFDANSLPELYSEDDLTLAGNLLYGENPSKPIKNTKINLTNKFGDVVETTKTNEFGAFAFRNLPSDQNYMIDIEEGDLTLPDNTKVIMTNKSGKEIKSFYSKGNKYKFNMMASDKVLMSDMDVDDKDLIMELDGYVYDQDKKPFSNAKLMLYNQAGELKQTISTDSKGKFAFRNLKAMEEYLFDLDESDPRLAAIKKLYIADAKGRAYRELVKNAKGKFQFKVLNSDKVAMGDFTVDDPWLQVLEMKNNKGNESKGGSLTIVENIYYAFGDYKFDAAGQKVLDKVIGVLQANPNIMIELSSHTDSRSSDEFNMALSQKRAKAAVDYIMSKGIDKKRLKAIGYGETRLLNKCGNGVECSDEEHAKNRRTEFKIIEMPKS